MAGVKEEVGSARLMEQGGLAGLLSLLARRGFRVIGPVVRDGAIVLDEIHSPEDLPTGWTDEQSQGHYRLKPGNGRGFFTHAVGPQSWKKYFFPAEIRLWAAERQNGTFRILNNESRPERPLALLGVRACDLAATTIQDRVLTRDRYHDPIYSARRKDAFLIVVQCTQSQSTCFCASLGTGPKAKRGFDLALTELMAEQEPPLFVIRAGSKRGAKLLSELETAPATAEVLEQETAALESAARQQVRKVECEGVQELLYKSFDDPRWETLAARCLTCANCTMVCPTCFCSTVEDGNDLAMQHAERWRRWDSCFTLSFSYIHGGSVRASAVARYRQWLTHKFAAWIDQFGTLGCVGCGRCITWCPVGIDITEALSALRKGENNGDA